MVSGDQSGDVADAPDIGVSVFLAESQPFGQVRPNLVAVQERAVAAELGQALDQGMGDGTLTRPGQPGEPDRQPLAEPGGLVSFRISATAGRLNHSGSWRPRARYFSRTSVPEMSAVLAPAGTSSTGL